jgi:hypothetical protein
MDIISHPTATPFRQFAASGTRRLQPHQAVEPTVPELGMLILGAAVYITHISKENEPALTVSVYVKRQWATRGHMANLAYRQKQRVTFEAARSAETQF